MRKINVVEGWVVYEAVQGTGSGMRFVCDQSEWEAIQVSKPGVNKLVRKGILNESEAEILARGTSGDSRRRGS